MADFTDEAEFDAGVTTFSHTDVDEAQIVQFGLVEGADTAIGDAAPPIVSFAIPSGTRISRTQTLVLRATDAIGLRKVLVLVRFANGTYEVAWDGAAFAPTYAESMRTEIAGGHEYALARKGGWLSAPRVYVHAIDRSGNEAV